MKDLSEGPASLRVKPIAMQGQWILNPHRVMMSTSTSLGSQQLPRRHGRGLRTKHELRSCEKACCCVSPGIRAGQVGDQQHFSRFFDSMLAAREEMGKADWEIDVLQAALALACEDDAVHGRSVVKLPTDSYSKARNFREHRKCAVRYLECLDSETGLIRLRGKT